MGGAELGELQEPIGAWRVGVTTALAWGLHPRPALRVFESFRCEASQSLKAGP